MSLSVVLSKLKAPQECFKSSDMLTCLLLGRIYYWVLLWFAFLDEGTTARREIASSFRSSIPLKPESSKKWVKESVTLGCCRSMLFECEVVSHLAEGLLKTGAKMDPEGHFESCFVYFSGCPAKKLPLCGAIKIFSQLKSRLITYRYMFRLEGVLSRRGGRHKWEGVNSRQAVKISKDILGESDSFFQVFEGKLAKE